MNDKVSEAFLSDNSYIWLVAKSMVEYMGFQDMREFLDENYYIKANLSQGTVLESASGRLSFSSYPVNYAEFVKKFTAELFPGGSMEQLSQDLDRNQLLSKLSGHTHFLKKEYALHDDRHNTLKLSLYCQLYLSGTEIIVAILLVDLTMLYSKNTETRDRAEFDTLTGTFSRAYGARLCIEQLEYYADEPAAVVAFDVIAFDAICDKYGQRGGNMVLVEAARNIYKTLPSDSVIIRSGPDEFTALIRKADPNRLEEMLSALAKVPFFAEDGEEKIGFRMALGYAMFPDDSREFSQLCRLAETALDHSRSAEEKSFYRYSKEILMDSKRGRTGFNMMDIADNIPGAILVYRAEGEEEIVYANTETVHLFECENFEDFMRWVHGKWEGFVYSEDYERIQREIHEQQSQEHNVNNLDYIHFRIITKNGVMREIEDIGHLVDSPYYGKLYYVFLHDLEQKENVLKIVKR